MSSIYSVTQISRYIGNMFAQDFLLNKVSVRGEISNCKYHSSGHIYFTLKDENAALTCIMFAGKTRGLAFRLENGMSIVAEGSVGVYERSGSYSLYVNQVRQEGMGSLYERFEALKRELEEMGLFDRSYKQPIPKHVRKLGVVTAPTGAAVRDIIQIAKRRNPGIEIILYPAKVQGDGAAASVSAGIHALDEYGVDVIIIGRGGGSIEDLWAFNEELTARAVFSCATPVISAVGHETDTVITDYVADLRAPTPSAAAELAVEDISLVLQSIDMYRYNMTDLMNQILEQLRRRLENYSLKLQVASPQNRIRQHHIQLDEKREQLQHIMETMIREYRHRLELMQERLAGLSPAAKLEQGYAYVSDEDGAMIRNAAALQQGDKIQVTFADGTVHAVVL